MSAVEGYGSQLFWGLSPALDLLDQPINCEVLNGQPRRILLLGSGDLRHLVTTLARRGRHKNEPLHFYVFETSLECQARQMLLLNLLLEPLEDIGLGERVEIFLELFGNLRIRQQTLAYLQRRAKDFISYVTDEDALAANCPILDLTQLKFKERDFIEKVFDVWRREDMKIDMAAVWRLRVEQYVGRTRYDARKGAADWDYQMRLIERTPCSKIINLRAEFHPWRETGLAFILRDEIAYTEPNPTLLSPRVFTVGGEKTARRGYWGDIVVGPYVALGVVTENEVMKKTANDQYTVRSTDVAQFNVTALAYELLAGTRYPLKTSSDICELPEETVPLDDVKVTFLPLTALTDLPRRAAYKELFDVIYIGSSQLGGVTEDLATTFKPGARIVAETAQFVLELKREQLIRVENTIVDKLMTLGYKLEKPTETAGARAFLNFDLCQTGAQTSDSVPLTDTLREGVTAADVNSESAAMAAGDGLTAPEVSETRLCELAEVGVTESVDVGEAT